VRLASHQERIEEITKFWIWKKKIWKNFNFEGKKERGREKGEKA